MNLPLVSVTVSPAALLEDGAPNLIFTFERTGATTTGLYNISFSVGGTAVFNTDYTQFGAGSFTTTTGIVNFSPGAATSVVTVNPTPDPTGEPDETVILTVVVGGANYAVGSPSVATGVITNDDTVALPTITLEVSPSTVNEDGETNLVYTFTRTGLTTNPLTVNYSIGGTATNGVDYETIGTSVTFLANASTAQVVINPIVDTLFEADEPVSLTISSSANYTIGTTSAVVGTIVNDDLPTITLEVSPSTVNEDGETNLVYTFTRTGLTTNPLTVNYSIGGTATNGVDYETIDTSVTFLANASTAQVVINPIADTVFEADEPVSLTISSSANYTIGTTSAVVGTITNDDLPTITLDVSPSTVNEDGETNLVYTFTRTGLTTNPLTVNYSIGGTATNGVDYETIGTSVTFLANSSTAQVVISSIGDTIYESHELVALAISLSDNYIVGTNGAVIGTLTNDDLPPLIETEHPYLITQSPYYIESKHNAIFEFVASLDYDYDPETGNYTETQSETITVTAKLRQVKDPNQNLQVGLDLKRLYFEGYLVIPKFYLGASYSKGVTATIGEIAGKFDFMPVVEAVEQTAIVSQNLLGQKIKGYFYFT